MNDNKTNRYTDHYMIQFSDAIQLISENTSPLKIESVKLQHGLGRVLAEELVAPVAIPEFNNSAMDGYAVNAKDLIGATKEIPAQLTLVGLSAAGDSIASANETKGKAWKIMTGAAVPDGFDSIIPVENTQLCDNQVSCFSSPKMGAHIRTRGEDFMPDTGISKPGKMINFNASMAYSALGISHIDVYQKINIAVFSTGKELVDDPDTALKPGQIRNSNKPFILGWLSNLPVNAYDAGTNYDEVEKFENDLQTELDKNTQIIISSGAVSMGDFDFIPQTIIKLGGEIVFHKSKIRPGKPILFAKFPNGTLYFGLPGNPISAAIGLRFFVSTAIRKMLNLTVEKPLTAVASNGLNKKAGFRSILKAYGEVNNQAQLEIEILEGQESFKIQPLLNANGWAVIREEKDSFKAGDMIEFYPSALNWE